MACRVAFSIFLVRTFDFGLRAIWIGIFTDWIVRACIFSVRFISGKWLHENMVVQKAYTNVDNQKIKKIEATTGIVVKRILTSSRKFPTSMPQRHKWGTCVAIADRWFE